MVMVVIEEKEDNGQKIMNVDRKNDVAMKKKSEKCFQIGTVAQWCIANNCPLKRGNDSEYSLINSQRICALFCYSVCHR